MKGVWGTPAKYAESVEFGTRPHWPPQDPILYWVQHKLGITGPEAVAVAFLIARKISRKGTKGAHMFDDAFKENEARVRKMLEGIPPEMERLINEWL